MQNYPIFQKEYVVIDNTIPTHSNFTKYLNWAIDHVQSIQFNTSISKAEIPLTFYPIAKNIRIPSSHMARNILNNSRSYIINKSRDGEADFWRNTLHRGNWYPWLWARDRLENQNYSNIEGWQYYFKSFTSQHSPIKINSRILQKEEVYRDINIKLQPPENLNLFFIYLACLYYTFQLQDNYIQLMNEYSKKMCWPNISKILAVQIRRGEICTKDGSKTYREFHPLSYYFEKIETLIKHNNYEYIYISTDSDEEIDKIKAYNPEWKLLYLPIDRTKFFRMNDDVETINGLSKTTDLEDSCRQYPEKIPFIVDSAIADLYFISQCQGYISTLGESEFSRCGWFLQIANQGILTPYIDINSNKIVLDMNKRDNLLLL